MYREMWGRLEQFIEMALEEGRDNGYDDPNSENYGKFYAYNRVSEKMYEIGEIVKLAR